MNRRIAAALVTAGTAVAAMGLAAGVSYAAGSSAGAAARPAVTTSPDPSPSPAATTAASGCHTPQPSGAKRYVTTHRVSLDGWAARHHTYPGTVLSVTILCGPGIQQRSLLTYLDAGNLHAVMSKGTVLWTVPAALP